jgi:hypothetical protein
MLFAIGCMLVLGGLGVEHLNELFARIWSVESLPLTCDRF